MIANCHSRHHIIKADQFNPLTRVVDGECDLFSGNVAAILGFFLGLRALRTMQLDPSERNKNDRRARSTCRFEHRQSVHHD